MRRSLLAALAMGTAAALAVGTAELTGQTGTAGEARREVTMTSGVSVVNARGAETSGSIAAGTSARARAGVNSPDRKARKSVSSDDTTSAVRQIGTELSKVVEGLAATLAQEFASRPGEEEKSAEPKRPPLDPPSHPRPANPTLPKVLATYGADVRKEFEQLCRRAGVRWPPARVTLLAFKSERVVEVWGGNARGALKRICEFPILAASGTLGPKIQEGDRQVPEGVYRVVELNPASTYHLSFKIDYPNDDDVRRAKVPRGKLGGEIYMHGDALSDGCIAMGFPVIEKLFCLMAWAQPTGRRVIVCPVDFRRNTEFAAPRDDKQLAQLYDKLRRELEAFPLPVNDALTSGERVIANKRGAAPLPPME